MAQQELERVEITGSSIRRVESEGALPVTTLKRADIDKSGATTVADLLQKLPGLQGATTEARSVGGDGGGFAGASIHGLGENRTLVLLNGRRLANYGGQTLTGNLAAFDLNSIPLAAIERVEILTDGASALYGSDAIAGVVNFITRRNLQTADLTVGASRPKGSVANEQRFSLSKGFGDLDEDGFNLLLSFSADKREPMNGVDRSFSKTGLINFDKDGKRYQALYGSPRAAPANATDDVDELRNPYYEANGRCAPGHLKNTDPTTGKTSCFFDFVAELETFPERERNSFFTTLTKKIGADHSVFADVLLSRTTSSGRIAPLTAEIGIAAGTPLHNQYLAPLGIIGDSTAFWRGVDLGRRTDEYKADFKNVVLGMQGVLAGWDYKTAITHSESDFKQSISGYPGGLALNRLRDSGVINPFLLPGQQSPAGVQAIAAANYKGYWDGGTSKLTGFDVSASRALTKLEGGALSLGTGFSLYQEKFQGKPSLFAQGKLSDPVAGTLCDPVAVYPDLRACDQRAGDSATIVPYSANRKAYGLFAELNAPIVKTFELTGAVRYDHYDDFGETVNGKGSFRWSATPTLLLRGAVGTGFRAPTVPQVKATPQPYGVTTGAYDRTPELQQIAARLNAQLQPNGTQYDVTAGGNADLKPEQSQQASIGFVFEPVRSLSFGADLWYVEIRDVVGQLNEQAVFNSPNAYPDSWTTLYDNATQITYLALKSDNRNLGRRNSTGIDFNVVGRTLTPAGRLTTQLLATYMWREQQQLTKDGPYFSAIGQNSAELNSVTFRWQGRFIASLRSGDWTNTLQTNFKSGYTDAVANVQVLGPGDVPTGTYEDIRLRVKPHVTLDWQTQWQVTKAISLTGGVLNVLDRDPPMSLAEGGLLKGQQYGYDDRYYDARGRTLYLNGSLTF